MFKKMSTAFAAITAAVVFAAPAEADQWDFVNGLDEQGIYYEDISEIIDVGKRICSNLRQQISPQYAGSPAVSAGYVAKETVIITYAAAHFMCPDQLQTIYDYRDGKIPTQSTPPTRGYS
ncbi:DUF732 domain-containing protein [Mycobacterium sp. 852013-51886_SCH5428379]|uniref:DUF732 domain-containing protein n=1 Tax=Mycobacterium sp. 852013-51886_SCH5428379 TaxID=1834111 RepID=UPI0018D40798|nr:DUF732 domain-containing protein [Mycobacterium sp. 852013-51886_SCH5428379]